MRRQLTTKRNLKIKLSYIKYLILISFLNVLNPFILLSQNFKVSGTVKSNENKTSIEKAQVYLYIGSNKVDSTYTNRNGYFEFNLLEVGWKI